MRTTVLIGFARGEFGQSVGHFVVLSVRTNIFFSGVAHTLESGLVVVIMSILCLFCFVCGETMFVNFL